MALFASAFPILIFDEFTPSLMLEFLVLVVVGLKRLLWPDVEVTSSQDIWLKACQCDEYEEEMCLSIHPACPWQEAPRTRTLNNVAKLLAPASRLTVLNAYGPDNYWTFLAGVGLPLLAVALYFISLSLDRQSQRMKPS